MLNYLQKYNDLPQGLKDKVSSSEIMDSISKIEAKYNVSLATVIMRVMVKDLSVADLPKFFVFEHSLDGSTANLLTEELKEQVFYLVNEYLGFKRKIEEIEAKETSPDSPATPAEDVHGSNFFFSSEDEDEVRELAEKVKNFDVNDLIPPQTKETQVATATTEVSADSTKPTIPEQKPLSIDEQVKIAASSLGINFSSTEIRSRFEKVLETYLRGIRNRIDTKQTIIKSVDSGGLGMDAELADKILVAAEKVKSGEGNKSTMKNPGKISVPEDSSGGQVSNIPGLKRVGNGDVEYDFGVLIAKKKLAQTEDKVVTADSKPQPQKEMVLDLNSPADEIGSLIKELTDTKPLQDKEKIQPIDLKGGVVVKADISDVKKENLDKKEEKDGDVSFSIKSAIIEKPELPKASVLDMAGARQQAQIDGKIKMEDVKYVPKLMGPIDELSDMSLVNFRRLASDPKGMVAKIEEKIKLLEEDGFDKRTEGIKAWRNSPVNKMYLEIGREAIEKKTGIDKIILEKQAKKDDCLTIHEFTAVMDLNKKIRF